jgi:putative nucleotidyltransferase with HDIG domain
MKKLNSLFGSFQTRVTLLFILAMLFAGLVSNLLIYKFALYSQFNQLRDQLMTIAKTATLMVDADTLMQIPLKPEGINFPQYKIIAEKLREIKKINPQVRYIYTMTRTDRSGIWQFIVDPELPSKEEKRRHLVPYPGKEYNAGRFPEMLKAFDGPTADKRLVVDEWGVTLSGYAPIHDKKGKSVAVLGVDIMADEVYRSQKEIHRRAIVVLILGLVLSLVLGMFISKKITDPIKKLAEGTRHIAREELHYRVEVQGADEIKELADSFNEMARSLYKSRRKLHSYFYRTVESLVRILEARDRYTKGHSERVAEYAEKIALKIGFPLEKAELLKETAVLHDIGKLGIEERILNKEEKLTDEEWELIRKHPIIGEDILRPVLLNREILAVVRGHHERHDGKGYPDRLSGEDISVFTQILSVSDAFDAMTSPRSYRPAMNRERAMEELRRNKGAQFNPKVVDVLIKVLEEEP